MSDKTCQEVFEKDIAERLKNKPELAESIKASFQFELTGPGGGEWVVDLTKSSDYVFPGTIENPGAVITMGASDFLDLVKGKLNGPMAFMTGKLKVKGDMSLALKLQQILG